MFTLLSPAVDVAPSKSISGGRLCKDDFRCIKVIGRGAFGEVQLVSLLLVHVLMGDYTILTSVSRVVCAHPILVMFQR